MEAKATVLGLGDVILDAPNLESFFENSKDMIRAADIAIANMEDPHIRRLSWSNPESHSAPASDLDNLRAYKYAGIDVATIGGNICNGAPSADSIGPMLVHDARVVVAGPSGEREVPLKDFYLGLKKLDMGPDELLKRIRIPAPPAHSGSFYIKDTRRNAMDLALLGVSAYVELEGDVMKTVRIALTTAAPTPIRAEKTEALLTGKTAVPELLAEAGKTVLQESHPRSSWRSSAEFRLALLEELTVQALEQAIALAKEG